VTILVVPVRCPSCRTETTRRVPILDFGVPGMGPVLGPEQVVWCPSCRREIPRETDLTTGDEEAQGA
jgi:hypothetical protein